MTDHRSRDVGHHRQSATHSTNDETAQKIVLATHTLSERLTAMTNYFGVARANLTKDDYRAADQMISRMLEQNEGTREAAEHLRAIMRERLL